jgi:membrane protease YdiL (CAAX protease family)
MQLAVMAAGAIAELVGWWQVSARRFDVWRLMPVVLGAMGLAAAASRPPVAAADTTTAAALAVGAGSGLALYAGTRLFVRIVAARWPRFRHDVVDQYGQAEEITLATSLALSLAVMVPSEELFWRGLLQARLGDSMSGGLAALLAWAGYVAANAASRSLPIVAGAIVGGALWTSLAWWSGGVLASLASHILWTGMMLALPPGAGRPATRGGAAR